MKGFKFLFFIRKVTIGGGIFVIIIAGIISFFLSISVDMSTYELGAFVNVIWPPFLTVLSILLFSITCWITRRSGVRLTVLVMLSLYLLYVGTALHFEKGEHWPGVIF